jgi:hypothetical protein
MEQKKLLPNKPHSMRQQLTRQCQSNPVRPQCCKFLFATSSQRLRAMPASACIPRTIKYVDPASIVCCLQSPNLNFCSRAQCPPAHDVTQPSFARRTQALKSRTDKKAWHPQLRFQFLSRQKGPAFNAIDAVPAGPRPGQTIEGVRLKRANKKTRIQNVQNGWSKRVPSCWARAARQAGVRAIGARVASLGVAAAACVGVERGVAVGRSLLLVRAFVWYASVSRRFLDLRDISGG